MNVNDEGLNFLGNNFIHNNKFIDSLKEIFGEKFGNDVKNILVKDVYGTKKIQKIAIIPDNNLFLDYGFWVRVDVGEHTRVKSELQHRFGEFRYEKIPYRYNLSKDVDNLKMHQKMYNIYKKLCNSEKCLVMDKEMIDDNKLIVPKYENLAKYCREKEWELYLEKDKWGANYVHKFLFTNTNYKWNGDSLSNHKFLGTLKNDEDVAYENNEIIINKIKKDFGSDLAKLIKSWTFDNPNKILTLCIFPKKIKEVESFDKSKNFDFGFDVLIEHDSDWFTKTKYNLDSIAQIEKMINLDSNIRQNKKAYATFNEMVKTNSCFTYFISNDNSSKWLQYCKNANETKLYKIKTGIEDIDKMKDRFTKVKENITEHIKKIDSDLMKKGDVSINYKPKELHQFEK